jgi:pimeloyl-ACP methyl ester carboxylesterase
MNGRNLVRGAAVVGGALAGLAAAAYGAQRVTAARVRRRPDDDAARVLETPIYIDHAIDTHDRGTIYVAENGEGIPVVMSHGVTNSLREWFYQLEALPKEGLRAIAFDHRGHGQSVVGETGHSLENLARDVHSVLVGLDLHDAVLVGHSMGGVAVQAFASYFPDVARERVAGIVLLSTLAHTPFGSRSTRTKARLEQIAGRVPDTTWVWESKNLGFVLARLGFGRDPHPSHVELVREMLAECPAETRRDAPRTLVGLDLRPDLPKIDLPALVVVGTADVLTPPAEAEAIARLLPNARLEVLPGGGHMLMLERADELNRLIADFAREVTAGRGGRAPVSAAGG